MRLWLTLLAPLLFASAADSALETPILGFQGETLQAQRDLETRFAASIDKNNIRDWIRKLSARPHHVGSPYGRENAEFIAGLFTSWGYQARIEEFQVLFPTPRERVLELLEPEPYRAALQEPALPEDSTSGQTDEQLPTYNAYSIDGDVTGELVYVNYGVPDDYDELERRGVDVRGKIVLARYGGSWRGIKPKVAAERGAVGCVLFSDPRDDGYFQGDVYPEGAYRNENGVQRGSVADMPTFPGDPLTPGVGAVPNAQRLDLKEAPTLTRIPVLPISYQDALPFLRALGGPVAPERWRGALPVTYHLGPGPGKARLSLAFNWGLAPAYDVIATIEGQERPDQWIIRGNHHDAWVNGASDPVSGMAALMEEARAVGALVKSGWKPRRTIVYAAWDAEEPGLIGSTEWVEAHAAELREKAAVYINSDSNGRGFLSMGGSHTLEKFINQVARDVVDPQTQVSVWERLKARRLSEADEKTSKEIRSRDDLSISALGSGSDYSPFLQHLGIASLNLGYGGENSGGSYHSIYDSFDHYSRFGDPGFAYGAAQAETTGRAVLRLAAAEVLPFEFSNFSLTVARYLSQVTDLAESMRVETEELNRRLDDRVLTLAADPRETYVAPAHREPAPHLNFAPLQNALDRLKTASDQYGKVWDSRTKSGRLPSGEEAARLDAILFKSERALTRTEGLPRRPWYVHHVYAPGFYTGYGVKTLPGVREAIEQRDWEEAEKQIQIAAQVIQAFSEEIDRATRLLRE